MRLVLLWLGVYVHVFGERQRVEAIGLGLSINQKDRNCTTRLFILVCLCRHFQKSTRIEITAVNYVFGRRIPYCLLELLDLIVVIIFCSHLSQRSTGPSIGLLPLGSVLLAAVFHK